MCYTVNNTDTQWFLALANNGSKLQRFKYKSYELWLVANQLGFKFKFKRLFFLKYFWFNSMQML